MPVFSRHTQTALYLPDHLSLATAQTAFFVAQPSTPLPATLSLAQAWARLDGCLIACAALPAVDQLLGWLDALANYLKARPGARFAWLRGSAADLHGVTVCGTRHTSTAGYRVLAEPTSFPLASNLALHIGAGTPITIDPAAGSLVIAPGALQLELGTTLPIEQPIRYPVLSTTPEQGCFCFALTAPLPALGEIGLRFVALDAATAQQQAISYPVLTPEPERVLAFTAQLDPWQLTNSERSALYFAPEQTLLSSYRNVLGEPWLLTSQPTARLAFMSTDLATEPSQATLYLAPVGPFKLTLDQTAAGAAGAAAMRLRCGVSGVEYIEIPDGGDTILSFFPGQPAQVIATCTADPDSPATVQYSALSTAHQTAWSSLRSSTPLSYYAQPDSAVLFEPQANRSYLAPLAVAVDHLPSDLPPAIEAAFAFPLVPYAAVAPASLSVAYQIEQQLLNPARRAIIQQLSAGVTDQQSGQPRTLSLAAEQASELTSVRQGMTAQGAQASFGPAGDTWLLARTTNAQTGMINLLRLDAVSGALRTALQSNQVLLVVSGMRLRDFCTLEPGFFGLTLQGWQFDLDPAGWEACDTVLIYKRHDQRLADLISDPSLWSHGAAFNADPHATRQRLVALVAAARQRAAMPDLGDAYAPFLAAIDNAAWSGVLILQPRLTGLPAQLQAIGAGLDPARLRAHHVLLNQTPTALQNGQLIATADTAIDGLIDYVDPSFISADPALTPYEFKVLSLLVLFQNREITRFASHISLLINQLFGAAVTLQDAIFRNNLLLHGSYERRDQTAAYRFVSAGAQRFVAADGVLQAVTLTHVELSPVAAPAGSPTLAVRWRLAGQLDFRSLGGFDLWSFGSEEHTGASGQLAFANLALDLRFNTTTRYKEFALDASAITLDLQASAARSNSLYRRFPLKLKALVQGTAGSTPQTLGYMPVDIPIASEALGPVWWGLQFDLNMGSLGGLARQAGLNASIIAAWSPNPDEPRVFVGFALPGVTTGKREIAIQGLLKLSFGDVRFVADGGRYVLQLANITLGFLTMAFPPHGQTTLMLFGDPAGQDSSTLGWYAAYAEQTSL